MNTLHPSGIAGYPVIIAVVLQLGLQSDVQAQQWSYGHPSSHRHGPSHHRSIESKSREGSFLDFSIILGGFGPTSGMLCRAKLKLILE